VVSADAATWQEVALVALNVTQTCILFYVAARWRHHGRDDT
jgi:hypothetical protein